MGSDAVAFRTFDRGEARLEAFGALMLLAPLAAGAAKAVEIDGDLLSAFAVWQPIERERLALTSAYNSSDEYDDAYDEMSDHWHEAMDAVTALPTRTLKGVRAKATVLRALLQNHVGLGGDRADYATSSETFAWSLVTDMLGRAAAFSLAAERPEYPTRPSGAAGSRDATLVHCLSNSLQQGGPHPLMARIISSRAAATSVVAPSGPRDQIRDRKVRLLQREIAQQARAA